MYVFLLLATLTGCDKQEGEADITPPKLINLMVSPIMALPISTSVQLVALGYFDDGVTRNVSNQVNWLSSDSEVAKVSASGLLTALSAGSVIVSAELNSISSQEKARVLRDPPTITGVPSVASSGLPYRFVASINAQEGASVSVAVEQLPTWLKFNAKEHTLFGTPQDVDIGKHTLTMVADDGDNTIRKTFYINVENGARYDNAPAEDFYAWDINNFPRKLENDLNGALQAKVQFVQSHSINASNNFYKNTSDEKNSRYMPDLVPERAALLLLMPDVAMEKVIVVASVNGVEKLRRSMRHPNELPRSDYNSRDGRREVVYSTRAWSIELPWDVVVPGLELNFIADGDTAQELTGSLSTFDFAAPAELVLRSIRLGMLTEPPSSDKHHMLEKPAEAAVDYFQTLPVARLIAVSYQAVKLDKTIVSDGTIYNVASEQNGSIYNGDMRQYVAKSQVSSGINLANVGITSNNMLQKYPHVFKQMTIHHAAGRYANGVQQHGLSGGNGMITLFQSLGNEHSHELGHAFGLGHYPGANLSDDRKWAAHHADSGWGYIAHRQRMRANLHWFWPSTGANINGIISPYTFNNEYSYNRDAMSSAEVTSPQKLSVYSHYTGYSARLIQEDVGKMLIPDVDYPSGYKKWDKNLLRFVDQGKPEDPRVLKPIEVGVQVTTLLGAYDPLSLNTALIYPAFEGNYGNLFLLPTPPVSGDACWLTVDNVKGDKKQIFLSATRHDLKSINQFHVNLSANYLPTFASISCREGGVERELTQQVFSGVRTAMPDAVIVGKDARFDALRSQEIPQIQDGLEKIASNSPIIVNAELDILLKSYSLEELSSLNEVARTVLATLQQQDTLIKTARRFLNRYEQNDNNLDEKKNIINWLKEKQLIGQSGSLPTPAGLLFRKDNRVCISSELINGRITIQPQSLCQPNDPALQWFMDGRGALHPSARPDQCLMPGNEGLMLADCDGKLDSRQRWSHDNGRLLNLADNRCIDHNNGTVFMYGCHMNGNQQWQAPKLDGNLLFSLLGGGGLRQVATLLQ